MRPALPRTLLLTATAAVLACDGGRLASSGPDAASRDSHIWEQPVPAAVCGADDPVETGLQGQVPHADRVSGHSQQGYACNLERVGQFQGEGAGWQFAWFEDCGYYGTANPEGQARPGVQVIDASEPTAPRRTANLDSVAMLDPWESLKTHEGRALLAGVNAAEGGGGPEFDIYDLSGGCAQPELLFSGVPAGSDGSQVGHAGNFAADGQTYYGTGITTGIYAIGLEDPANPQLVGSVPHVPHDLSTNADGTRVYATQLGLGPTVSPVGIPYNGLVIFDSTLVQQRVPGATLLPLSTLFWEDGALAQMTQPVRIDGHPYLIFVDEGGAGGRDLTGLDGGHVQGACDRGLPPFGFARIIDISNELQPFIVSKLMLEVHDPANCETVLGDEAYLAFGYDSHYCNVDDIDDAEILACSYMAAGLRVFDIRDPYRPREIAYYIPPAQHGRDDRLEASQHLERSGGEHLTVDWSSAHVRILRERGEIWTTSQDNGFQVLRFSRPLAELLEQEAEG